MSKGRQSRKDLEKMLLKDRAVIRTFYEELQKVGLMPAGVFTWTKKDARRLAQEIAAKAREHHEQATT